MRIGSTGLAAGIATLTLMGAQPAWATHSTAVFTGLATIHDVTGVMGGDPDTTLDTTFELTFTVDDATPGSSTVHMVGFPFIDYLSAEGADYGNPVRGDIEFGNGYGFSSGYNYGPPDGGASGNATRAIVDPGAGLGPGGALAYGAQTYIFSAGFSLILSLNMLVFSPSNFGQAGVNYNRPFTYAFGAGDQVLDGSGTYRITTDTPQALPADLSFSLTPLTLTVTSDQAAGVPEPGVWALMLAGFGGVGAALRRRRQVALV